MRFAPDWTSPGNSDDGWSVRHNLKTDPPYKYPQAPSRVAIDFCDGISRLCRVQLGCPYGSDLLSDDPALDAIYVPIGMSSGICSLIAMRELFGLKTDVIGVAAEAAPAFYDSFLCRHAKPGQSAATFADGVACRKPDERALDIVLIGAADIINVSEAEISEAIRVLYTGTHNLAEGAGAAAIAALLKTRERLRGKRAAVLAGETPRCPRIGATSAFLTYASATAV
jgi:hypothetical protein